MLLLTCDTINRHGVIKINYFQISNGNQSLIIIFVAVITHCN